MKKIKKYFLLSLVFLLVVFVSCSKYSSHFKANYIVSNQAQNECHMTFDSLDGTFVFKLKCKLSCEGTISYDCLAEEGEFNVYYDYNDNKALLFHIKEGEKLDDESGTIEEGTVYILIETVTKSKGYFSIHFVN